jgi:hypothetical protein
LTNTERGSCPLWAREAPGPNVADSERRSSIA